jgi:hypothetical protein
VCQAKAIAPTVPYPHMAVAQAIRKKIRERPVTGCKIHNPSGPERVKALRAQIYVINSWDSAHPTMTSLDNMLSKELYPGPRMVFATAMKPESVIALRRIAEIGS